MARHSSSRVLCSQIQRSFVRSRLERQLLTRAFEQALPGVRRQLPRASQENIMLSIVLNNKTQLSDQNQRSISGGCS